MSGMGGSPRSSLGSTSPSSDERNSSYDSLDSPGHTGAALEAQALVFDTRLSPVARNFVIFNHAHLCSQPPALDGQRATAPEHDPAGEGLWPDAAATSDL